MLLPLFIYYDQCCYGNFCTHFCVHIWFRLGILLSLCLRVGLWSYMVTLFNFLRNLYVIIIKCRFNDIYWCIEVTVSNSPLSMKHSHKTFLAFNKYYCMAVMLDFLCRISIISGKIRLFKNIERLTIWKQQMATKFLINPCVTSTRLFSLCSQLSWKILLFESSLHFLFCLYLF